MPRQQKPSIAAQMSGNVGQATSMLKALSNETRIMLMCLLMDGEKSAGELAQAVDMRLPAISQHLSKMRASGLVSSRKDAQTVFYKAKEGVGHAIVGTLCEYYR